MFTNARNILEIAALLAVAWPIRALPRPWALRLGAAIGRLGWWTGIRRSLVLKNLHQAFPKSTVVERKALGREAACNLGRTVAEFLRFAGRDRKRIAELIEMEGFEALREELTQGKGALLVTAHLGAWALYTTALATAGIPTALLVGKQRNPYVDRLILGIPGDVVRFISKGKQAPRQILECLRDGHAVVMVADHYISSEAVWAPFLGKEASTLPLPGALLAKRPELQLFLLRGLRGEGGRHHLGVRRLDVPQDRVGDDLRLAVAALCNEELGKEILENPQQYWWYHDRWKVRGKYQQKKKVLGQPPTVGGKHVD